MKYEIRREDEVVGLTNLEGADPPMGFVFGAVEPTEIYRPGKGKYQLFVSETNEKIATEEIVIEDHSELMGEQCVEVTVLVATAEEYEKFFSHHKEAYTKLFSGKN